MLVVKPNVTSKNLSNTLQGLCKDISMSLGLAILAPRCHGKFKKIYCGCEHSSGQEPQATTAAGGVWNGEGRGEGWGEMKLL